MINKYNNNLSISDVNQSFRNTRFDNSSIALKVENISKIYEVAGVQTIALRNINFNVKTGEFISIVGPSGSGKSTLLNILGALDRPTFGKVYIGGIDVFSLKDSMIARMRNNLIGFIFQSFNLINRTTVQRNVEIPAIIAGMGSKDRAARSMKLLNVLGIGNKAKSKPVNLSGGQQQRVAIARALINNPTIILADEPTGNLDTKTGKEVFDLLKSLSKRYNRTIIFVTHNPDLAELTDRSVFIKDGQIEKDIYH